MIKDIQELNFPSYATMSAATVSLPDMGEWNITSQIKIDGQIAPDFSFDWEVLFKGHKYIMPLRKPQGAKENTTLNSVIDLTFQHWAIWQLKRFPFVTMQPIDSGTAVADEEVATVSLNLLNFCNLFGQVLDYYYGDKITIQLNPDWQSKAETEVISISHTKVWNVLIEVFYKQFGVRWQIEPNGSPDKYVIKAGYPTTEVNHIFEYGFEGSLMKVERQVQSEEICNLLKGRGGEKNLPLRYFKNIDKKNDTFKADPDWIEELKTLPFNNLMPATFRSYVQGWKAAHLDATDSEGNLLYQGYTPVGETNAYAPWAYRKGFTDEKFHPVEFVADEITIDPEDGDRQVEILPGYAPYVKEGSSLDEYGPLQDSLDDNEEIYPTIQGVSVDPIGRVDEVIEVEPILSDDVEGTAENDAKLSDINGWTVTDKMAKLTRKSITVEFPEFTVEAGKTGVLIEGNITKSAYRGDLLSNEKYDLSDKINLTSTSAITVINVETGEERSASGIPEGRWKWKATFDIEVTYDGAYNVFVTVGYESPQLEQATLDDKWKDVWHVWVKNIWGTSKQDDETDEEYAERVWRPILGDRIGNEAKLVFTSGALAMSEDYEFVITDIPKYERKSCRWETVENGVTVVHEYYSEWCIPLGKSDADLDALGVYLPSVMRQAAAGDFFFFIGIDMPHQYVKWGEERVDNWKKDNLIDKKEIKPTWVVRLDRIRIGQRNIIDPQSVEYLALEGLGILRTEDGGGFVAEESGMTRLIDQLVPGNTFTLSDKRFIKGSHQEKLYISSVTYSYREPTSDDAALNPDVEIVLSDRYVVSANPVATLQGEVSALAKQIGSISNIEQIVRAVADRTYLRKDGINDRSYSPTEFASLVTSLGFRSGMAGGAGWGFYKDESNNWVLEIDRIKARMDLAVNNLVINQVTGQGGTTVESAARMEITRVEETADGYKCYFDQKSGTVANMFHVGDVAWNNRYTAEDTELKSYRRRVTEVGADYVMLTKERNGADRPSGWPDSGVNGTGVPAAGDAIVQRGSCTDAARRFMKVRDVIGGGYERYVDGLDSVNAEGEAYYFAGRTEGQSPRWFVGRHSGKYIEWKDGELLINGKLTMESQIGDKTVAEVLENGDLKYLSDAFKQVTSIENGLVLTSLIKLGINNADLSSQITYAGISGLYDNTLQGRSIAAWYGGNMIDAQVDGNATNPSRARSLFRMDGTGYLADGNLWWDTLGNLTLGSGITVEGIDGTLKGTLASILNYMSALYSILTPLDKDGNQVQMTMAALEANAVKLRSKLAIYSHGDVAAFGETEGFDGGGGTGGTAYERLDSWSDYTAAKAGWVLSAGLGAELDARLSHVEGGYLTEAALENYATKEWVQSKGYLTSGALTNYITRIEVAQNYLPRTGYENVLDGRYYTITEVSELLNNMYNSFDLAVSSLDERLVVVESDYLTQSDLTGYATESWVQGRGFITSTAVETLLSGYLPRSGGVMTGALFFEQPGSVHGFYIEAVADGSVRINATENGEYVKNLLSVETVNNQLAINNVYIGQALALGAESVVYGSLALSESERIYLNHTRTVWVRYNASLNMIEASHGIVAHGDVEAMAD